MKSMQEISASLDRTIARAEQRNRIESEAVKLSVTISGLILQGKMQDARGYLERLEILAAELKNLTIPDHCTTACLTTSGKMQGPKAK